VLHVYGTVDTFMGKYGLYFI